MKEIPYGFKRGSLLAKSALARCVSAAIASGAYWSPRRCPPSALAQTKPRRAARPAKRSGSAGHFFAGLVEQAAIRAFGAGHEHHLVEALGKPTQLLGALLTCRQIVSCARTTWPRASRACRNR